MNLTKIYYNTNDKKYIFEIVKRSNKSSYVIEIQKWSSSTKKYIYENILGEEVYTELYYESFMNILQDDSSNNSRSLFRILTENNIKFREINAIDNSFYEFTSLKAAEKVIKIIQELFRDIKTK